MSFKAAELNYPVHEKELLAIIRALRRWRVDLMGNKFLVYTDHRMLESFDTQKDLSRRQARWMEFLSQYDYKIVYVKGEDNTVADALSRTKFEEAHAAEAAATDPWGMDDTGTPAIVSMLVPRTATLFLSAQCLARTRIKLTHTQAPTTVASILSIKSDVKLLDTIHTIYRRGETLKRDQKEQ